MLHRNERFIFSACCVLFNNSDKIIISSYRVIILVEKGIDCHELLSFRPNNP